MSDYNEGFSRRKLLKTTSVTAVGGYSGIASVSAVSEFEPDELKHRVVNNERVQLLVEELENPEFTKITKRRANPGDMRLTVVTLSTSFGKLIYGKPVDGESTALFKFDSPREAAAAGGAVPQRYQSMPKGVEAVLTLDEDVGVVLLRTASKQEQKQLAEATGATPSESMMFYNSKIDGFEVHPSGQTASSTSQEVHILRQTAGSVVVSASTGISQEVTDLSSLEVETVEDNDRCAQWAVTCAGSIGTLTVCLMTCGSVPITPPAMIGCVLCLTGSGVSVGVACTKLVDECR